MLCPFCSEEIRDAATVCRFCNRDLVASRPLLDENLNLKNELAKLREELTRFRDMYPVASNLGTPIPDATTKLGKNLLVWTITTIAALISGHFIMQIIFDSSSVVTYTFCAGVAIICGVMLASRTELRMSAILWIGLLVGITTVIAVSAIVSKYYHQPLLPPDARVGQDSIEFAISIWLGIVGGAMIAGAFTRRGGWGSVWAQRASKIIYELAFNSGAKDQEARIKILEKMLTAIGTVAALMTSIVAAIKAGWAG